MQTDGTNRSLSERRQRRNLAPPVSVRLEIGHLNATGDIHKQLSTGSFLPRLIDSCVGGKPLEGTTTRPGT